MSSLLLFFFLMLRRLPRSTLFPYTTLFRSTRASGAGRLLPAPRRAGRPRDEGGRGSRGRPRGHDAAHAGRGRSRRSEEHTSELQSHSDLVCRLLLEKKKNVSTTARRACADQ